MTLQGLAARGHIVPIEQLPSPLTFQIAVGLQTMGYVPYSLRRLGVTSAYRQGEPMDVLVIQGRWQHIPAARIYINANIIYPPAPKPTVRPCKIFYFCEPGRGAWKESKALTCRSMDCGLLWGGAVTALSRLLRAVGLKWTSMAVAQELRQGKALTCRSMDCGLNGHCIEQAFAGCGS